MNLEKLIAEREGVSTKPFPVPVAELLARYWVAKGQSIQQIAANGGYF